MTAPEFVSWLDGYLLGAGRKVNPEVIKKKMAEIAPLSLVNLPPQINLPQIQTATSTGYFPMPLPYNTCDVGVGHA